MSINKNSIFFIFLLSFLIFVANINLTIFFIEDKTIQLVLLNILSIVFYMLLLKKLIPLKKFNDNNKDEISEILKQFNKMENKINQLESSRNLFLRNIMHELKTPLTKASLVSDMMDDGKHKESLKRAFSRLQYLLEEFAKIEKLTSQNIDLQKNSYRLVDILDEVVDILMIDKGVLSYEISGELTAEVDFQLFALALKNLIDNGLKYSNSKVIIQISKNYLAIKTQGEKLPKELKAYLKPFNRKYENSHKSLGLGLYVVDSILKAHDLTLGYKYEDNQNIFFINFKECYHLFT